MELIDRYLHAVKFWLPRKQKQDIIAELSEDLRSQIEDKEAELGHTLNESEVAALLKQRGRPILVANRFLPQESLIGPTLFPIYLFVLKIVAAFYMVPWILVWTGIAIVRATHSSQSLIATIGLFWTSFWPVTLFWVGGVTIVFAILERVQAKSGFLEEWDPRKLPPVRDPNRIARSSSIVEVAANMVFCIWWIIGMWYQSFFHFAGVTVTLAPVWRYFFWGFLFVSVVNVALAAANLFHPHWSSLRAGVRLASDCAGSVLFCWLLKSNFLAGITVPNVEASKTQAITNAINWWDTKMVPAAIVICTVIAAFDVYRIIRLKRTTSTLMPQTLAPAVLG